MPAPRPPATDTPISIRRAVTPAEYRACQDAQRRAWGIAEDGYVVPIATMVGAQLHGGVVLGAFLDSGQAVGLSFGFLARIEGRIGLYSQLTGVVPEWQGRGLGERLKHAQRDIARAEGLPVIAWAFDPLQAGNAHFNLVRLGAVGVRLILDMYGPRTDSLNAGVPTDRLIAVWETEGDRAGSDPAADLAAPVVLDRPTLVPEDLEARLSASDRVRLEIPSSIARLRAEHAAEAEAWRVAVRDVLLAAFSWGFRVTGFVRAEPEGQKPPRTFHVLTRTPAVD
jgi:predicted GNAT superfamily acetyltransferase